MNYPETPADRAAYYGACFRAREEAPTTREEAHRLADHWIEQSSGSVRVDSLGDPVDPAALEAERDLLHECADAWCDLQGIPATAPAQFILWNPKDGSPHRDGGAFISDGVIGRIGAGNAYLTAYAEWPDTRRPGDLQVGERIAGVRYRLSGRSGTYDVWRVS